MPSHAPATLPFTIPGPHELLAHSRGEDPCPIHAELWSEGPRESKTLPGEVGYGTHRAMSSLEAVRDGVVALKLLP